MSYKSRQKKRTISMAQSKQRQHYQDRWYLTLVTTTCSCATCGRNLRARDEMVYRHTPRSTLCPLCAEIDPNVKPRPSLAWERERVARRRK